MGSNWGEVNQIALGDIESVLRDPRMDHPTHL